MSIKALERHLAPLQSFIEAEGVTEICINQPREVYIEKNSQFTRHDIDDLSYGLLDTLAALVAEFNHKDFPVPLLAGSLPTGERIQLVMPPACEKGKIICSIRKHQMRDMTLEEYEAKGAFAQLKENQKEDSNKLLALYQAGDFYSFIREAVRARKNILISGGTGTGKTTFLNACLKCVPAHERLITVEDTREVMVTQPNAVNLLFNEEDTQITASNLFKVCLRLRPDRIFLSELRGAEVWPYLRAANSGHPGSLSTVHADTPEGALTQLVFMMQQAGSTSSEEQIRDYIKSIIHIVVQLKRDPQPDRFMVVSEIYFTGA
jgi:type IV secretion system protein VirB11